MEDEEGEGEKEEEEEEKDSPVSMLRQPRRLSPIEGEREKAIRKLREECESPDNLGIKDDDWKINRYRALSRKVNLEQKNIYKEPEAPSDRLKEVEEEDDVYRHRNLLLESPETEKPRRKMSKKRGYDALPRNNEKEGLKSAQRLISPRKELSAQELIMVSSIHKMTPR